MKRTILLVAILSTVSCFAALCPARAFGEEVSGLILSDVMEARGVSLGDAQAGLNDASAAAVNPAAAAAAKMRRIGAFVQPGPLGKMTGDLSYVHPITLGVISAGLAYRTLGTMDFATSDGTQRSVDADTDILVRAGFGMPLAGFKVGASVKYLSSSLVETYSASAVMGDLGVGKDLPIEGASVGVAVRNVGTGLKYHLTTEKLPMEVRGGGAYAAKAGDDIDVLVAADGIYGMQSKTTGAGIGLEGTWKKMVSLRAGYCVGNDLKSIVGGVGFAFGRGARLDYSIEPMGSEFGMSHGLSLSYDFKSLGGGS